jgi:hypothetical protein
MAIGKVKVIKEYNTADRELFEFQAAGYRNSRIFFSKGRRKNIQKGYGFRIQNLIETI